MNSMLGHVVEICLVIPTHRIFCVLATFGLLCFMIASSQKCHAYQIYDRKSCAPPTPSHLVIVVGPFAKWGIDFMTYNPHLVRGHGYIIVVVEYFTKWVKLMPTYNNTGEKNALLLFNHVIVRFGVPRVIVIEHGNHFSNQMMSKLIAKLGFHHKSQLPTTHRQMGKSK